QPAEFPQFLKRLPHADEAGAAARRIEDDVWQAPAELLRDFQAHRLFALQAVGLLERGHIEPVGMLDAFADDAATIVDEAIDEEDACPAQVGLDLVDDGGV